MTATGFFGIPGKPVRNSHRVHYVVENKPACGTPIHPKAEFQWCAHGLQFTMLECERCIKMAKQLRLAAFTLIELLVVIAILAILAAIILPQMVGSADGSKVGVITSIEWNGSHWNCELSQQGVKRVSTGKTSYLQENMAQFSIDPTGDGNKMAEKIQSYQGHVLRISYHRTGMVWQIKSVDDLGLAEQP